MTGKLAKGCRLTPSDPPRNVQTVIFRGFGAVRAQDEYGLPQWREVAFLENETTGDVLPLNVGYLEGFDIV